jgi:hypothetical protein
MDIVHSIAPRMRITKVVGRLGRERRYEEVMLILFNLTTIRVYCTIIALFIYIRQLIK